MEIVVNIEGIEELTRKLENPELLAGPTRKFLNEVGLTLQSNIQQLTPVDTGRLRASITTALDPIPQPLWVQVYTNVEYGEPVEMGSRPHWTSWTNLNEWAYRHNMNVWALTAAIARRGTRAHHMFTNSAIFIKSVLPEFVTKLATDIESEFGK
jgi:hypothetical protein